MDGHSNETVSGKYKLQVYDWVTHWFEQAHARERDRPTIPRSIVEWKIIAID